MIAVVPQLLVAGLLLGHLALHMLRHGQPMVQGGWQSDRPAAYNANLALVRVALLMLLLWAGGFFR